MIVERFLEMLMPPYVFVALTVHAKIGNETVKATGSRTLEPGFRALGGAPSEQALPELSVGMRMNVSNVDLRAGETSPPKHFTEATLLQAMENPQRFMQLSDKNAAALPGYKNMDSR